MRNFLIWGDSITYGAGDPNGGWVGRLRSEFWDECSVYNLGISGDTTTGILQRFELEAKRRADPEEETICIFAIGINDSIYLTDRGAFQTELQKFSENIHDIYIRAKSISSHIALVGLTPVDETKTCPTPWAENKIYKNEFIARYNGALQTLCRQAQLPFVDVFSSWGKERYTEWLYDGLHPNARGYDALFLEISSMLKEVRFL